MFDFKFNWDESIDTNIEVMDSQHKELFRIGRAMEQLILTGCENVEERFLLDIVCSLRDYVGYHFYEEEQLMKQYQYSKMEEHIAEHKKYRDFIQGFDCKKLGREPLAQLKYLKDEVQNMVFFHMLSADKDLAAEIRPKMK